ncbi:MAG: hypothetical protein K2L08_04440 [Erysipelotrichaceae bacterium]|nr:hypothetical protein [Erysipelotrichaceae bacterium]
MTHDIMPLYESYIDKKKTIKLMKAHLEFLRKHIRSLSFEDYQQLQQDSFATYLQYLKEQEFLVHEDAMEYLNCNKGIVSVLAGEDDFMRQVKVSSAVIKEEKHIKEGEEQKNIIREHQARWILAGIAKLKNQEKKFIIEKFIFNLDNHTIMERHHIVESTLNRNLVKAYLHLAIILKTEVLLPH